jgi:hypothetical protein
VNQRPARSREDVIGLEKAYDNVNNVHYDHKTDTLFVAGTHQWLNGVPILQDIFNSSSHDINDNDVLSDLAVPNGLENTKRYRSAETIFKLYRPTRLVGHSLGAAITKTISDQYFSGAPNEHSTYYGAPFWISTKLHPWEESYRHRGDPISVFGANIEHQHNTESDGLNPHSFTGHHGTAGF